MHEKGASSILSSVVRIQWWIRYTIIKKQNVSRQLSTRIVQGGMVVVLCFSVETVFEKFYLMGMRLWLKWEALLYCMYFHKHNIIFTYFHQPRFSFFSAGALFCNGDGRRLQTNGRRRRRLWKRGNGNTCAHSFHDRKARGRNACLLWNGRMNLSHVLYSKRLQLHPENCYICCSRLVEDT